MKFQTTDVAIIGGGLAGATAAAMLGRAGVATILIDPHTEHRQEFRCEKLDNSQLALLRLTGLAGDVLPHACVDGPIGAADVAEFYADPVKVRCEAESLQKAMWLRGISTETSVGWRCWRGARFVRKRHSGACVISSV